MVSQVMARKLLVRKEISKVPPRLAASVDDRVLEHSEEEGTTTIFN